VHPREAREVVASLNAIVVVGAGSLFLPRQKGSDLFDKSPAIALVRGGLRHLRRLRTKQSKERCVTGKCRSRIAKTVNTAWLTFREFGTTLITAWLMFLVFGKARMLSHHLFRTAPRSCGGWSPPTPPPTACPLRAQAPTAWHRRANAEGLTKYGNRG
jgi:hypothetical protein